MLLFLLAAAAASAQPGQILAGPAFEQFARRTDAICPARKLRFVTPGDLSWEQESFQSQLSARAAKRLAAANHQDRHCAGRDGLSCPTTQTLDALRRLDMLDSFSRFACAHPQP